MDLVFNDLSTKPVAKDISEAGTRLCKYFNVIKKLKEEHGFQRVRYVHYFEEIKLTPEHSFSSFCHLDSSPRLRTISNALLGLSKHPFIDDNSEEEERYLENRFYISKEDILLEASGLGTAYLYNTIAVSFDSEEYWRKVIYPLIIKGKEEQEMPILALCYEEHCEHDQFKIWKDNNKPVEIIRCKTNPKDKEIKLREDHGRDVLNTFAKRLRNSPYVVKIVNSLPFNSRNRDFIKSISDDGLIEIVLTHTDEGFGMVVQTTGRNRKETELIAEILKNKYAE